MVALRLSRIRGENSPPDPGVVVVAAAEAEAETEAAGVAQVLAPSAANRDLEYCRETAGGEEWSTPESSSNIASVQLLCKALNHSLSGLTPHTHTLPPPHL